MQGSPLNHSGWSPLLAPVVFSQHKFDLKSCMIQALPTLTKREGSMLHTQRPAHTCWHSHQVRHSGFPHCQVRCLLRPGSLFGAFCSLEKISEEFRHEWQYKNLHRCHQYHQLQALGICVHRSCTTWQSPSWSKWTRQSGQRTNFLGSAYCRSSSVRFLHSPLCWSQDCRCHHGLDQSHAWKQLSFLRHMRADLRFVGTARTGGPVKFFLTV